MKLKPIDIVIIIITSTVCLSLLLILINPFPREIPLDDESKKVLGHLMSGLVSIISVYVGMQLNNKRKN